MTNSERYPKAWEFYIENARNITMEPDLVHLGNYRIPKPDGSGIIYADTVTQLWSRFIKDWNESVHDEATLYNKIQYIVTHFNH